MIAEDYVSFETAKLLKEKGFDEPSGFVYSEKGELMKLSDFGVRYLLNSECDDYPHWQFPFEDVTSIVSAPTLQMAMKWLREKHIVIIPDVETFYADGSVSSWEYHIWCDDNYEEEQNKFSSYEEACEAAIKYCLENLI